MFFRRMVRGGLLSLAVLVVLVSCGTPEKAAVAEAGTVRLDSDDYDGIRPIRGVWEVYPGKAFSPEALDDPPSRRFTSVPPRYGRYYTAEGTRLVAGTITYRLVFEDVPSAPLLGVGLPPMYGNHRGWVNGTPLFGRVLPLFPDDDGVAELILQTDRGHYPFGGLTDHTVTIGPVAQLSSYTMVRLFRDGLIIGTLLFLGIYSLFLAFGPNRDAPTVTFAILVIMLAVRLFLLDGEGAFFLVIPLPTAWYTRMIGLATYPVVALLLGYIRRLYPHETRGRKVTIVERVIWAAGAVSLVIPLRWWMDLLYATVVVFVVAVFLIVRTLFRALRGHREGAEWMTVAVGSMLVVALVDLARTTQFLPIQCSVIGYGYLLFGGFSSVAVFLRVVDFRISLANLKEQAQHDGLTGLYNRRVLDAQVQEEYLRHARAERPLGLIMLDVDQFKGYNDTLGHQAGDEVLRVIAGVLEEHARRGGDIAARYGGEEFALVLPHTDIHGVYGVAESIRRSIEGKGLRHPTASRGIVTVSLGAAVFSPSGGDGFLAGATGLYRAADRALYEAKSGGRNAVRTAVIESNAQGEVRRRRGR
ncbi:MAG: diguanylate cyclase [Alkalispirochaeta sp.]